ncbi:helix-turn-helix domain-containing protein [Nonomuraea mangrovi]|uniref:Helix-turn-helix domain-containing protein n=1 Tax=Nonomuraea mangrovi TaxID=2316207 RepID=A0ABW4TEH4_9ACTN
MREPEVRIQAGAHRISVSSFNGHDYRFYPDQIAAVKPLYLHTLAQAIIAHSNDHDITSNTSSKDVDEDSVASICFHGDDVLPWDETDIIMYLDLTRGEEFTVTFFGISQTDTGIPAIERASEFLLRRFNFLEWEIEPNPEGQSSPYDDGFRAWIIKCKGIYADFSVGDLCMLRQQLSRSIFFTEDDSTHPRHVVDILEAGQAHAMLEMAESETLEVKRTYFGKPAPIWKVALAQAVSSFANAEKGGVLIIGMSTETNENGDDIIKALTPLEANPGRRQQHLKILNERIFPPIEGLEVGVVEVEGGDIVYVVVPPQAEELKPFIVHGGIVEGHEPSNTFSITRRRGDHTIPVDVASLHSTIVSGRTFIRSGLRNKAASDRNE